MTPAIQVILFCVAIGQFPKGLPVAVYNPDRPPPTLTDYSKNFLDQIDKEYIQLVCYSFEYFFELFHTFRVIHCVLFVIQSFVSYVNNEAL